MVDTASAMSIASFNALSEVGSTVDVMYRMPAAKLFWVDCSQVEACYEGVFKASLRPEQWLVAVGGILSKAQINHMTSRSGKFDNAGLEEVVVHRPAGYGRAAVVASKDFSDIAEHIEIGDGLADVKGCGVARGCLPYPEFNHNNGLLFLNEAICECVNYLVVSHLACRAAPLFDVLPHLGIVDLGVKVEMPGFPSLPVCTLVRAPHFRSRNHVPGPVRGSPTLSKMAEIETFLQSYGVTSTREGYDVRQVSGLLALRFHGMEHDHLTADQISAFLNRINREAPYRNNVVNVQLCDQVRWSHFSKTLVDFQHYKPIITPLEPSSIVLSCDGMLNWGLEFDNSDNILDEYPARGRVGKVNNVYDQYSPCQREWIKKFPGILSMNWANEIFSMKLVHKYLSENLSIDEINSSIVDYVTGFVEVLFCHAERN